MRDALEGQVAADPFYVFALIATAGWKPRVPEPLGETSIHLYICDLDVQLDP